MAWPPIFVAFTTVCTWISSVSFPFVRNFLNIITADYKEVIHTGCSAEAKKKKLSTLYWFTNVPNKWNISGDTNSLWLAPGRTSSVKIYRASHCGDFFVNKGALKFFFFFVLITEEQWSCAAKAMFFFSLPISSGIKHGQLGFSDTDGCRLVCLNLSAYLQNLNCTRIVSCKFTSVIMW